MKNGQHSNSSNIRTFLAKDVPPSSTPEWVEWQKACLTLGDSAPDLFIKALKLGNPNAQYAALLGLRLFGYEAFGHGYYENLTYSVKKSGRTLTIKPKIVEPSPLAKR